MSASDRSCAADIIVTSGDPTDVELAAVVAALLARGSLGTAAAEPAATADVRQLASWRREPSWRRRAAA